MAELDPPVGKKPRSPRRKPEGPEAQLESPDPVEIAMKAVASGADRHGAARAVLEKHACLIDIQCQREREEWHVLRVQRLTRWLLLLAVAGLILGLAALLWNASKSNALVVEPFGVPPALERQGLTGKVISARVLDRLAELQRQTESTRAESSYANNWEENIQVDIPQTGMSLGQAWRFLRSWLGEETRIGGEVVQTPTGLSITTRAGSVSGGTVEGTEAEFNMLLQKAAETIYKATQPYRYAISLPDDRRVEREQVLLGLTDHPDPKERKWAYSGLAVTYRYQGDFGRAIAMAKEAVAIDGKMIPGHGNLGFAYQQLGHDEAAISAFRTSYSITAKPGGEFDPRIVAGNNAISRAIVALLTGDAAEALHQARSTLGGISRTYRIGSYEFVLAGMALAHNHRAAANFASRADLRPEESQNMNWPLEVATLDLARAVDLRDAAAAGPAAARMLAHSVPKTGSGTGRLWALTPYLANRRLRVVLPLVAASYARFGRIDEAAALARQTPTDCYRCVRTRGLVAAAAGDRREAQRWFAEAVRQAPSVPYAYLDWGEVLMRSGALQAAMGRFAAAHEKGPRWADPLKYWGDALGKLGRNAEALEKYRDAAERAPRWGALHFEWGKALWRSGDRDEAMAKFRAAAKMDLSAADRERLQQILAREQGRRA